MLVAFVVQPKALVLENGGCAGEKCREQKFFRLLAQLLNQEHVKCVEMLVDGGTDALRTIVLESRIGSKHPFRSRHERDQESIPEL